MFSFNPNQNLQIYTFLDPLYFPEHNFFIVHLNIISESTEYSELFSQNISWTLYPKHLIWIYFISWTFYPEHYIPNIISWTLYLEQDILNIISWTWYPEHDILNMISWTWYLEHYILTLLRGVWPIYNENSQLSKTKIWISDLYFIRQTFKVPLWIGRPTQKMESQRKCIQMRLIIVSQPDTLSL